jgi:hypothetical protein
MLIVMTKQTNEELLEPPLIVLIASVVVFSCKVHPMCSTGGPTCGRTSGPLSNEFLTSATSFVEQQQRRRKKRQLPKLQRPSAAARTMKPGLAIGLIPILGRETGCQNGTGMIRPRTFLPRTLSPDVFTSPYVSSPKESQPTELHHSMDWLGI